MKENSRSKKEMSKKEMKWWTGGVPVYSGLCGLVG